jgi:hypothetical protein
MLRLFPFSKLSKRGPVLRVYAIERAEPPVIEREFPPQGPSSAILEAAREFMQSDCSCEVEGFWDLWEFEQEWKLQPAVVTLACFGAEFDRGHDDDLRIEFGPDSRFLPPADADADARDAGLKMVQSNIRSLLHLVGDLERELELERRQLWSESGENFAAVLLQALGAPPPGPVM